VQAVGQLRHRRGIDQLWNEPILDLLLRIRRRVAQCKPNEPQDLIFVEEGDVLLVQHSRRKVSSEECALRSCALTSSRPGDDRQHHESSENPGSVEIPRALSIR
jgi:hypothetical protein